MKTKHIIIGVLAISAVGYIGYIVWKGKKSPLASSEAAQDIPAPKLSERRKGGGDKLVQGGARADRFGAFQAPTFSDNYAAADGYSINDAIVQRSRTQLMY